MSLIKNSIKLSAETVDCIKDLISNKFESDKLKNEFPNLLLREDTLALLDKYCTVIYYPLADEDNNGFHITGIIDFNGTEQHFVFINTAQTIEKQVFTAAHELGHAWKVDEYVANKLSLSLDSNMSEQIINRFAAELLIPEDTFRTSFELEFKRYQAPIGKITRANMLKVIVGLMNQFFAPMKAILYRCFELDILDKSTVELLLGNSIIKEDIIKEKVSEIIQENGYVNFQKPTNKKWIEGLANLLEQAEKQSSVSSVKIDKIRRQFDIKREIINDDEMNEILN